ADFTVERVTVNGHAVAFEGTSYRLFEVAEDTTLRVTFKEDAGATPAVTHVITAVAGLHGSIAPSGACKVVQGDSQLFQFKPHRGFEVDAVLVDGVRVQDPGTSYLFENVEGDHRIEVTFRVEGLILRRRHRRRTSDLLHFAGVSGGTAASRRWARCR
ncbi:MAG: hypothetical protein ACLT98_15315, partial [Eggerthellaceae bacterium]